MRTSIAPATVTLGRDSADYDDAALERLADLLADRLAARLGGLMPEQSEPLVDAAEIARRRAAWSPRASERLAGVLEKYARLVGPARLGAVTHAGAVEWPVETPLTMKAPPAG